ncbi:MAG: PQQ-dependent dehydrogenase, methanol/ethanol family [Gammaproteobacteria bacterium]
MRFTVLFTAALIFAAPFVSATEIDDAALANEADTVNWPGYGRTYSEQRHSPLTGINDGTVTGLGVAWYLDLPNDRSLTGTPLAVDGVLYFNGSYNVVRAVEAKTGKLLWEYDPKVTEHTGDRLRMMWDWNRGIAFWKGRVYNATIDGRLIAIDAKTGKEVWTVQTFDPKKPLIVTGAPKVFRDKVIIGNGGTEWGPARGFVTAYDTETGEQAWRFYTVPGNPAEGFENNAMKMAAKTWTGEWWEHGGGGTVWHGITYDPEFNHVYLGTGNGSPWNPKIRSPEGGDNLFLCSIVALDADTGEYKWHYQTTPGEAWDYNSNMDIVLADIEVPGPQGQDARTAKVILHAPKNGFFYIINRANGKLLSAEPYAKVDWATHIDMKTGKPVERAGARYEDGEEVVWPSPFGAHNWHAMAYSPDTKLAYFAAIEMPGLFTDKHIDVQAWESPYWEFDAAIAFGADFIPDDAGTGALRAWDPLRQQLVWEVPLPGVWNPGVLSTAGNLVFQGRADGTFWAYRATDGEALWHTDLGVGISAPPITYSVDGEQYVSILTGWGGAGAATPGFVGGQHGWAYGAHMRRLVTFKLGGQVALPAQQGPVYHEPIVEADFAVDDKLALEGAELYIDVCMMCHGAGAGSAGYAPDLRASPTMLSLDAMRDIVIAGSRRGRGMPNFPEFGDAELTAIQHYVRRQANTPAPCKACQAAN